MELLLRKFSKGKWGPKTDSQQDHNSSEGLNSKINLETMFYWFISCLFLSAVNESICMECYKANLKAFNLLVVTTLPSLPAFSTELTCVYCLWPCE